MIISFDESIKHNLILNIIEDSVNIAYSIIYTKVTQTVQLTNTN